MSNTTKHLKIAGGLFSLGAFFVFFAAFAAYLFLIKNAFDLMGLAVANFLILAAASLLANDKELYFKTVIDGVASKLTATVTLILLFAGIFSALIKEANLATSLLSIGQVLGLKGATFSLFTLLATALFATATGSSIGAMLTATPIFFPAGVLLGADPAAVAGAIFSGAIFGDNLAPVSDVTIVSALTQKFKNGDVADVGGVVKSRLPYAFVALLLSIPFYLFTPTSVSATQEVSLTLKPLIMLLAVFALVVTAIKTKNVLLSLIVGVITGVVLGLASGLISTEALFSVNNGQIQGVIYKGLNNMSGLAIMLMLLFGFVAVVDSQKSQLKFNLISSNQRKAEGVLALTTLAATTLFAGVTSASVALVGAATSDATSKAGIHPYRRSHILSGFANSLPVLMPFSAFTLIMMGLTSGLVESVKLTPIELISSAVYPMALFVVFATSIIFKLGTKGEKSE